jgi:hypothetical protein
VMRPFFMYFSFKSSGIAVLESYACKRRHSREIA